jgi:DNA/RNA-binding domain of Phe-tRNA-synthetase-like protein
MNITIDKSILELQPNTKLAIIEASVKFSKRSNELKSEMEDFANSFRSQHKIEDIAKIQEIADTRKAYRSLGKEPARYRVSSESLLRRIVQAKSLYYINNIVDCNNYISIKTGHAVCCFDKSKVQGNVSFKIAAQGTTYKGIGKDELNIEYLPVFTDINGAFGSPTSDSQRTMITENTKDIIFVIVNFSKIQHLHEHIQMAENYLVKYCDAQITSKVIV